MSRSVFIVAAESSGDLHGAELARALRERDAELDIVGFGGPRMADAGVEVVCDLTEHAAVGISEALRSIWAFHRGLRQATDLLDQRRPDAVVLIDSPELNLRLAPRAHDRGIPVAYYICPQVWAWRKRRLKTLARHVDKRLVILPFETQFYARHGVKATFVGHPLVDTLQDYRRGRQFADELALPDDGPLIGILPGSRRPEISRLLPILLTAAHRINRNLEGVTLATAPASSVPQDAYRKWPTYIPDRLHLLPGQTYELMAAADLLLIASGTATLEAGIIGTPMIVTYRVSPLTWLIARSLVRGIEYVSLVNLVAERELVPELLQRRCSPGRVARKAVSFFRDGGLTEMADALAHEVRSRLGEPGAAGRAADEILALLP